MKKTLWQELRAWWYALLCTFGFHDWQDTRWGHDGQLREMCCPRCHRYQHLDLLSVLMYQPPVVGWETPIYASPPTVWQPGPEPSRDDLLPCLWPPKVCPFCRGQVIANASAALCEECNRVIGRDQYRRLFVSEHNGIPSLVTYKPGELVE